MSCRGVEEEEVVVVVRLPVFEAHLVVLLFYHRVRLSLLGDVDQGSD